MAKIYQNRLVEHESISLFRLFEFPTQGQIRVINTVSTGLLLQNTNHELTFQRRQQAVLRVLGVLHSGDDVSGVLLIVGARLG